jgi:hypothetical protein
MPLPILISASAGDWDRLVGFSGLPGSLFCGEPDPSSDTGEAPLIFCGEIPQNPEELPTEELERLDQLLFACRDGRFLHLHHCTESAEKEWEKIKAVSDAWSRLVGERKRRYESYIRPVMVIVGGDSTIGGESDFRKLLSLLDDGRKGLAFRDFYLMSPRLEPSGHEIFHARVVWPISVGRLMLLLSSLPIGNSAGQIYGWRFTEFRHLAPEVLYRDLVPACSDDVLERLRSSGADPLLPSGLPITTSTKWEVNEPPRHADWSRFPAIEESTKASDPDVMIRRLSESALGEQVLRVHDTVNRWHAREEELAAFWKSLHRLPGAVWRGQAALDRQEKNDFTTLTTVADEDANGFLERVKVIESAAESLSICSRELREAQVWFVRRPWRFAVAVAAASFLGILFYRATQLVFDNLVLSSVTATACFVGAFLGMGILFLLENARGEKGAEAWGSSFEKYESALKKLDQHFCTWKNDSAKALASFRRVTLNSRIGRMLARVTDAIVFSFENQRMPSHSKEDDPPRVLRYLERSTIQFSDEVNLADESREDMAKHAVQLLRKSTYLDDLCESWGVIWNKTDPLSVGAVSIHKLQSAIASKLSLLPGLIDDLISGKRSFDVIIQELEKAAEHGGQSGSDLFSIEVSDIARVDFKKYRLVAAKYSEELSSRFDKMPDGAEAIAPFLLIELATIRLSEDLTSLPSCEEVSA